MGRKVGEQNSKFLMYQAINENVKDTTARQVIRYVIECEVWNLDTISPSNQRFMEKYGWSLATTRVAISKAKKSQFITTTGRGKSRTFELNVGFLKCKMAEIQQRRLINNKKISKEILLEEFIDLIE